MPTAVLPPRGRRPHRAIDTPSAAIDTDLSRATAPLTPEAQFLTSSINPIQERLDLALSKIRGRLVREYTDVLCSLVETEVLNESGKIHPTLRDEELSYCKVDLLQRMNHNLCANMSLVRTAFFVLLDYAQTNQESKGKSLPAELLESIFDRNCVRSFESCPLQRIKEKLEKAYDVCAEYLADQKGNREVREVIRRKLEIDHLFSALELTLNGFQLDGISRTKSGAKISLENRDTLSDEVLERISQIALAERRLPDDPQILKKGFAFSAYDLSHLKALLEEGANVITFREGGQGVEHIQGFLITFPAGNLPDDVKTGLIRRFSAGRPQEAWVIDPASISYGDFICVSPEVRGHSAAAMLLWAGVARLQGTSARWLLCSIADQNLPSMGLVMNNHGVISSIEAIHTHEPECRWNLAWIPLDQATLARMSRRFTVSETPSSSWLMRKRAEIHKR